MRPVLHPSNWGNYSCLERARHAEFVLCKDLLPLPSSQPCSLTLCFIICLFVWLFTYLFVAVKAGPLYLMAEGSETPPLDSYFIDIQPSPLQMALEASSSWEL